MVSPRLHESTKILWIHELDSKWLQNKALSKKYHGQSWSKNICRNYSSFISMWQYWLCFISLYYSNLLLDKDHIKKKSAHLTCCLEFDHFSSWFPLISQRLLFLFQMCSSRKYPCPPQGRLTEIPRRRRVSKAPFLKESTTLKWNFWRGGGVQTKKPSVGGVSIFSGTTQCSLVWLHTWMGISLIDLFVTKKACPKTFRLVPQF